jgi:hypothetical protein
MPLCGPRRPTERPWEPWNPYEGVSVALWARTGTVRLFDKSYRWETVEGRLSLIRR